MKSIAAYTLLELVVVFGILAVLIGFSVVGLIGLRESAQLNKTVSDFVSEAKTQLSDARNDVYTQEEIGVRLNDPSCSSLSSSPFSPDAKGYFFIKDSKEFRKIKCVETDISIGNNYCCVMVESIDRFDSEDADIVYTADCEGVLFEYATGQVLSFNPGTDGGTVNMGEGVSTSIQAVREECLLNIENKSINYSKDILFDPEGNGINVQ